MRNYGNTCYCNAVLQCLKRCPPTRPCVDKSLEGPEEHRAFVRTLSRFGNFGRFACDASEFLLKILDEVDAFTGEFRTHLHCPVCDKEEDRMEEATIVPICANDDVMSLLTSHRPDARYMCECGEVFQAKTTFYSGDCLVLHFICRVTLQWVQSLRIRTMRLVALVFYTGVHYTAYCLTESGWKTFDDDLIYAHPPRARPYMAFFTSIKDDGRS